MNTMIKKILAGIIIIFFLILTISSALAQINWIKDYNGRLLLAWENGQKNFTILNGESATFFTGYFASTNVPNLHVKMNVYLIDSADGTTVSNLVQDRIIDVSSALGYEEITITPNDYKTAGNYFVVIRLEDGTEPAVIDTSLYLMVEIDQENSENVSPKPSSLSLIDPEDPVVSRQMPDSSHLQKMPLKIEFKQNTAPIMEPFPLHAFYVAEGEELSFKVEGTDAENNSLTFELRKKPLLSIPFLDRFIFTLPVEIIFNQQTGEFSFTPGFDFIQHPDLSRTIKLQFRAYDGQEYSSWENVAIYVQDVNQDPVLESLQMPSLLLIGEEGKFIAEASDVDYDSLDYMWDFGDSTILIGKEVTKEYSQEGHYLVKLTIQDGLGGILFYEKELFVSILNKPALNREQPLDLVVVLAEDSFSLNQESGDGSDLSENTAVLNLFPELKLSNIFIYNENFSSTDLLHLTPLSVHLQATNAGKVDLKHLKMSVSISDLGLRVSGGSFDLMKDETHDAVLHLPLLPVVPPGKYIVKITLSNQEIHRSAYRIFTIE